MKSLIHKVTENRLFYFVGGLIAIEFALFPFHLSRANDIDFPPDDQLFWKCYRKDVPAVIQYKKTRRDSGLENVIYGESCVCEDCTNDVDIGYIIHTRAGDGRLFTFYWTMGLRLLKPISFNSDSVFNVEFFQTQKVIRDDGSQETIFPIFRSARSSVREGDWVEFESSFDMETSDHIQARIKRR